MPRPSRTPWATSSRPGAEARNERKRYASAYRLEQLQHETGGWALLAAYQELDPALKAAGYKSGHIRLMTRRKDGSQRCVGQWRNGKVMMEVEER